MNAISENWIFFAAFALLILVPVVSYLLLQSARRAWEELAARLGMAYTPGNLFGKGLSLSGSYRGQQITADIFTRYTGSKLRTYTRIVLFLKQAAPLDLEIYSENLFNKVGKLLRSQDIHTGDEEIDRRFIIKGQPEEDVKRLLLAYDLRQKLAEAPALHLKLHGQEIYYEKRGFETNENKLLALFDLMTGLAGEIERANR